MRDSQRCTRPVATSSPARRCSSSASQGELERGRRRRPAAYASCDAASSTSPRSSPSTSRRQRQHSLVVRPRLAVGRHRAGLARGEERLLGEQLEVAARPRHGARPAPGPRRGDQGVGHLAVQRVDAGPPAPRRARHGVRARGGTPRCGPSSVTIAPRSAGSMSVIHDGRSASSRATSVRDGSTARRSSSCAVAVGQLAPRGPARHGRPTSAAARPGSPSPSAASSVDEERHATRDGHHLIGRGRDRPARRPRWSTAARERSAASTADGQVAEQRHERVRPHDLLVAVREHDHGRHLGDPARRRR